MDRSALVVAMLVGTAGCADEVVGSFAATLAMSGSGGATGSSSSDAGSGTGSPTVSATGSDDSSGDASSSTGSAVWTGGCYGDDFDDGVLDDTLWWPWVEGDSGWMETAGWMKFDPPTFGLLDTGLVTNSEHTVDFDFAYSRMQIPAPPQVDRPVVVFLQVIEDPAVLSFNLSEGVVTIGGHDGPGVNEFQEQHPEIGTPAWVGIRAEEPNVHFEWSSDGVQWTTFATFPKPASFSVARPLIMVQTYGDYPDPQLVAVDNFETCVD